MKHAFVGCIHGIESEPVSDGETTVDSDGESSTGETESLYEVQDGRFRVCSIGGSIPDPFKPPNRVAIFMAGTQLAPQSSTAAAMIFGLAAGEGGPARPSAQVLSGLMDGLATLLTTKVNPDNRDDHNVEVRKLREWIAQAKEDMDAEETRMAK